MYPSCLVGCEQPSVSTKERNVINGTLTARVEDARAAVEGLPALIGAISVLFSTPSGLFAVIAVSIWLLLKVKSIPLIQHFSQRRSERVASMEKYLDCPEKADITCVRVVQEMRDTHMFRTATGIYAEKRRRDALVSLHERVSHVANWRIIRRAHPFLEFNARHEMRVRSFNWIERVEFAFNTVIMFVSFAVAALLFVAIFFLSWTNGKRRSGYTFPCFCNDVRRCILGSAELPSQQRTYD